MSPKINVGGCKCRHCRSLQRIQTEHQKAPMLPTGESSEITLRRVEVILWELLHSGTTVKEVDTIMSDLLLRHGMHKCGTPRGSVH